MDRGNEWRKFARDVRAVSPVIGTVLVLFIVLLAMAGIMMWGVPAIQGLQDHAEFQSILTQALQVNAELHALRDPQQIKHPEIVTGQGQLFVSSGSRWAVTAAATDSYRDLKLTNWEVNNTLKDAPVQISPLVAASNVSVDRVSGGTFTQVAFCWADPSSVPANECTVGTHSFTSGGTTDSYRLVGNTTRIQVKEAGILKAEIWVFDVGRLSYYMKPVDRLNRIHMEMGAVFVQQQDAIFLEEAPSIKEPVFTVTPKDTAFFVRTIEMDGDSSISGKGRHSVLLNLVDNYGVTRGRPLMDPAKSIRFQIDDSGQAGSSTAGKGLLEEAFCRHLVSLAHYTSEGNLNGGTDRCVQGDVNVVYDPADVATNNNGLILYELSHAVVKVVVGSS